MQQSERRPEEMLAAAVLAARSPSVGDALTEVLDQLPAAIYVTDADGVITHFNRACIALAGRTPEVGRDKWCVTWRLHTLDGEFLPHDQCPMAVAIRERREIRGVEAVAERPDGGRINFTPYPTPLFDDQGAFVGAVNMLVDVTQRRHGEYLQEQAARCRRLAASVDDQAMTVALTEMAAEYESKAAELLRPN